MIEKCETLEILKKIYEIEKRTFPHPYEEKDFQELFEMDSISIFYEKNISNISSYIIVLDTLDTMEILKIATLTEFKNRGLATNLINFIKKKYKKDIFLEVRFSNLTAINFYLKNDFEKIALRKNYYSDNNEDAIIMQWRYKTQ